MLRPSPTSREQRAGIRGWDLDRAMDAAITTGLTLLITVGFATSYRTLRDLAITEAGYPPWLAPTVPLSLDLGIIVLSLKVVRTARDGRTALTLRLLVIGLSLVTVLANASAADTLTASLLHALPPAMFVICFESIVITQRRDALAARGSCPSHSPESAPSAGCSTTAPPGPTGRRSSSMTPRESGRKLQEGWRTWVRPNRQCTPPQLALRRVLPPRASTDGRLWPTPSQQTEASPRLD